MGKSVSAMAWHVKQHEAQTHNEIKNNANRQERVLDLVFRFSDGAFGAPDVRNVARVS